MSATVGIHNEEVEEESESVKPYWIGLKIIIILTPVIKPGKNPAWIFSLDPNSL